MKHKIYTSTYNVERYELINMTDDINFKKHINNILLRELTEKVSEDGLVQYQQMDDYKSLTTTFKAEVVIMAKHDYDYMMDVLGSYLDFRFMHKKNNNYVVPANEELIIGDIKEYFSLRELL
ncbi:MAG: hypothetical protein K9L62_02075 [Vallitaleaceae bacterium]|nr:hypothetical protein [Vallitaleaceae bacterium]